MAIVPGAGNCIKALFAPAIAPILFEKWGLSKAMCRVQADGSSPSLPHPLVEIANAPSMSALG